MANSKDAIFLGIDLGTTALKAVLSDGCSRIFASTQVKLTTQRPKANWSEQDPEQWWRALVKACAALKASKPTLWLRLQGLSFSGQMHGVVLLSGGSVLRPCILWNDGRATKEAIALNQLGPWSANRAGVRAMAGFSAPKLKWLHHHEHKIMAATTVVLAPKDYLRWRLTGELATDPVDASGMWLMDVAKGTWEPRLIAAAGLDLCQLPPILSGDAMAGAITAKAAQATGLPKGLAVAVGTGDAAANSLGLGLIAEGDGVISLGTSAQIFVSKESHAPEPSRNIHAFAHGLPGLWFQMAALLNGASPLAWYAQLFSNGDVAQLLKAVAKRRNKTQDKLSAALFLPYLAGERTPHDAPHLRAGFFGLDHRVDAVDLAQAVLEGVALSLADCAEVMATTGTVPKILYAVGGGFRSTLWAEMIASALGRELHLISESDYGGCLGAARLARRTVTGEPISLIFAKPEKSKIIAPRTELTGAFHQRLPAFRAAVQSLCV